MANPIQQGLKRAEEPEALPDCAQAAMANPIQQGLKLDIAGFSPIVTGPQWLIQYNKD